MKKHFRLVLNALAANHQAAGQYQEAELSFRQALEIRIKNLGETHPDTLEGVNYLAQVLNLQGKTNQATNLFVDNLAALKAEDKNLGVVVATNNLAQVYMDAEKICKGSSVVSGSLHLQQNYMVKMIY